ncbi:MAG TPA: ABC transporter substrate-binding protein [Gammaproteobacteria bacterium]|nr:ABC transporter substrate-binding protein [Gammaproteobacteria bacterium]
MKRGVIYLGLLILLLWAGSGWSAPEDDPVALVKATSEQMLKVLRKRRAQLEDEPELIYELVEQIALPHFDFTRMSRWVLGRYWRKATPEQRRRFEKEFRTLLVKTYATSLLEFVDDEFRYPPQRLDQKSRKVTVRTEVLRGGGAPVRIEYRMFKGKEGWKAYDVLVEGVSLVANYRSSFADEIRQKGLDGLITRLARHNNNRVDGS